MSYTFFTIPINDHGSAQQARNSFCSQHRVARIDKHFVADGGASFWAICVTTANGPVLTGSSNTTTQQRRSQRPPRVDYREVLSPDEFTLYDQLRQVRKRLAEQEGVPTYALFTNEQLAQMVQGRVTSKTGLMA
jgi:superfamily II DNA helicase RecQ